MLKTIVYIWQSTSGVGGAWRIVNALFIALPNVLAVPDVGRALRVIGIDLPNGLPLGHTLAWSAFLIVLIALWNTARRGSSLEEAAHPKIVIDDVIEIRSEDKTSQRIELIIRNSGGTELKNCLAKIESISSSNMFLHRPRALRTYIQSEEHRAGPFNLRVGETKHIPFLTYSNAFRASGAQAPIYVEYETEGPHCSLDASVRHSMVLAIYSEGPETREVFDIFIDDCGFLDFKRVTLGAP